MPQPDHHTTSKADFIKAVKADPAEAIRTGKLKQVKAEVPFGGIGKVVAKVAEKVVEKGLAKATANASKIVGKDVSKPGTLEKLSQNMSESEKRALASKLKEANVKDKPGLNARSTQAKDGNTQAEIDAKHLADAYAKSLKASKAAGLDPSKVKVTYKGNSMGYKG